MRFKIATSFFIFFSLVSVWVYGQDTVVFSNPSGIINIGDKAGILEDKNNQLDLNEALQSKFIYKREQVPNLQISKSAFWVKILVANHTNYNSLALQLNYPTIDSVTF